MTKEKSSTSLLQGLVGLISSQKFNYFIYFWFVFQAVYMALSTNLGISPDEIYHYSFIQLFAKNGWLPFIHNQTGYYMLGEVFRTPYFLYNYLLSLPYHFIGHLNNPVVILRLINISLGLLSLYFVSRISDLLKYSNLVKNISLFIMANTLMFVFLSGMLNYDNLLILLTMLAVYLLLQLKNNYRLKYLFEIIIVLIAGLLTVINFVPIAIFIFTMLMLQNTTNLRNSLKHFGEYWKVDKKINIFLSIVIGLLFFLFLQRTGFNIVKYHSLSPSCIKVNTQAQCLQSEIYVRDQNLNSLSAQVPKISIIKYTEEWVSLMNERTFGIFGHKSFRPTLLVKYWSQIFLILGVVAVIRIYKIKENTDTNIILMIILFYIFILLLENYKGYRHTGVVSIGVQGRYLFTVYPLILLFLNHYILRFLGKISLQSLFLASTIVVFFSASLPSYLIRTDQSWYTQSTEHINREIHNQFLKFY